MTPLRCPSGAPTLVLPISTNLVDATAVRRSCFRTGPEERALTGQRFAASAGMAADKWTVGQAPNCFGATRATRLPKRHERVNFEQAAAVDHDFAEIVNGSDLLRVDWRDWTVAAPDSAFMVPAESDTLRETACSEAGRRLRHPHTRLGGGHGHRCGARKAIAIIHG